LEYPREVKQNLSSVRSYPNEHISIQDASTDNEHNMQHMLLSGKINIENSTTETVTNEKIYVENHSDSRDNDKESISDPTLQPSISMLNSMIGSPSNQPDSVMNRGYHKAVMHDAEVQNIQGSQCSSMVDALRNDSTLNFIANIEMNNFDLKNMAIARDNQIEINQNQ